MTEESKPESCPKCGKPTHERIRVCPICYERGCAESCNPLGKNKPCRDCEQSQTS
jgi:hypothetical protein